MRFILRREFFGSLAYDTVRKDYIYLDKLATLLLTTPDCHLRAKDYEEFHTDSDEVNSLLSELKDRGFPENTRVLDDSHAEGVLSGPLRVFYEITYRCTERCQHCYTESHNKHSNELTLAEKLSIVDQLLALGCYRISVAGGEPLIDKDFFPFVEYALDHQLDVSFSTNAIAVTERVAQRLAGLDIRTINVSLDGWDDASFGAVRGHNRLQYVLRGISTLRKYYPHKIAAKVTLMATNARNVDKIVALAHSLGLDEIKFNCVREAGRAAENRVLLLGQDEYLETIQRLAAICNEGKCPLPMTLPINPYQDRAEDSPSTIDELGFGCYAGKESFCVNPVGDIQPCSNFGPGIYCDGNVRTTSLKDAWFTGRAMTLFRSMDGADECKSCPAFQGCRGGCHLRSFKATGDIRSVDPYCYERRNKALHDQLPTLVQLQS